MATEIDIVEGSILTIRDDSELAIRDDSAITVKGIDRVQNIAPIAAHIKEVNHIDPISVEALFVSQVRNIEPIAIEKLNVTNLPELNMSLRQLPPVELDIRKLPAISVGTHQCFDLPSNYTLRAQFLGIEVLRLELAGNTRVLPRERYRREQARTPNASVATVATAGNPAIPSSCHVKSAIGSRVAGGDQRGTGISYGLPENGISLSMASAMGQDGSSVRSGG
jgi:hypothetical protein